MEAEVVTAQPTSASPSPHTSLQRLHGVDSVLVDQKFEVQRFIPNAMVYGLVVKDEFDDFKDVKLPEIQTDWEGLNSYGFADARGAGGLFLALEKEHSKNACCCSCSSSPYRSFNFQFWDDSENRKGGPVFEVARHFNVPCLSCCCLTKMQEAVVTSRGVVLGYVRQPFLGGIFVPKFEILDENHHRQLLIKGSFNTKPNGVTNLEIFDAAGEKIGEIHRKQKKMSMDMKTDADFFNIRFPSDFPVAIKAVLFGAVIFVDFVLFEGEGAATTAGHTTIDGEKKMELDVEERGFWRFGCCDLFCCGCMLRC